MKKQVKKLFLTTFVGSLMLGTAVPAFAEEYVVKPGDTLWKLAKESHVSLSSVLKANYGVDSGNLQIGSTIKIPNGDKWVRKEQPTTYIATNRDTMWAISKKFNIPLSTLLEANPSIDPLKLRGGMDVQLTTSHIKNLVSAPKVERKSMVSADIEDKGEDSTSGPSDTTEDKVETKGNKSDTGNGQASSNGKTISMIASAYSDSAKENGPYASLDSVGNPLKTGTVSVDPSVIPIGTKLYITGYKSSALPSGGMIAYATDTGSAIKGNKIDLFIPGIDDANNFGIQNIQVQILN
jgi:3D (Asp-Asp-Asp) domain-containing protein/LysM repeat protein